MGPSKPPLSGAPFSPTTQLYRNEAKSLRQQLQFNRNVPAVPENLSLRFSNPHPIIIEKLKSSNDQRNLGGSDDPSIRSSGMFSVISEERLKLAIHLAKRDIKRRHLEEQVKQQVFRDAVNKSLLAQKSQEQINRASESLEKKIGLESQTQLKYHQKLVEPSKMKTTSSGTKVFLYTPNERMLIPAGLGSSLTHNTRPDPKTTVKIKENKNIIEIQQLQKELRSCVQKIEDLTKKERDEENLDADEQHQVCTQRQKQAARSAQMLYVLQQQVKKIQDDLEKLSPYKIKHTKKSRAVSKLAAAHRGAIRALQAFANLFTDQTGQWVPTHYKELGSLIRQLSLCSAKLELDSSTSDVIIDILMQVEDLISLLERKQTPRKVKECLSASHGESSVNTVTFPARKQLTTPKGENKPLILKKQRRRGPRKSPAARGLLIDKHQYVAKISAVQKMNEHTHMLHDKFQDANDLPAQQRNTVLQGSLEALVRSRAVKKDPILQSGSLKKKDTLLSAESQGMPKSLKPRQVQPPGKHARFQETTIAFQLKENKRFVKESSIPWVPSNSALPPASPKRLAWREAEASRRMKVLTDLNRREMKKGQKLRLRAASPTQCADKVDKAVCEHLELPLDRAQIINISLESNCHLKDPSITRQLSTHAAEEVAASADILSEKVLDDLLEDTAQELWNMAQCKRLQAENLFVADGPSLEAMLQRMEEIERYQETVCRRFTQIVYSDSEFRAQEDKFDQQMALITQLPTSPHSIQITKLTRQIQSETDISFEKIFDDNGTNKNKEAQKKLLTGNNILQPLTQNSVQKKSYISFSITKHMLQSILDYSSKYKHHLNLIFHEAVGSFNPWQIAESLAEELTDEALFDVAAELQDVCEDYAEAVFTSEFLQPA
ncbi:protein moonraker isoform X3 [Tympanuchus pallidicinctus]|uniref:protein moonraker isoform X1 n=1 Tax=Tympanuchus pallidicinctus TaxID=109042 RepID=UPI002287086C|nr:protein moonraker isoform X1 [Tympanuchus pallidicinctus]XP_052545073.1 protein moonraker isoform X2 [Tympanuchus pallidicinctus]XP_052545074.1 protein moonraker isoform X3 [Tympanuchus pallidicinctus]XP_052545079.1 protein moonraker isoform X3 [Tympanuchus pallidicinctus]